jgi:demethylmenaquinone methyltransferase/2-methoxy-6-polyprenyl-1,4-benzoquinol methylase
VLRKAYDLYSFNVLPWLGERVAGDQAAYRYLAESIRRFPDQATFARLIEEAGLEQVRHRDLSGGIAALHSAWRL